MSDINWTQPVGLYLRAQPMKGPPRERLDQAGLNLNQAVALAMRDGPQGYAIKLDTGEEYVEEEIQALSRHPQRPPLA